MSNIRKFEEVPGDALLHISSSVLWFKLNRTTRGFSSYSDTVLDFSARETAILELLSKGTTQNEVIHKLGISDAELVAFFSRLEDWSSDALKWCVADETTALKNHTRAIELARMRDISMAMSATSGQNATFHAYELVDAQQQFDDVETTISHAFRQPHPALNGRTYGEAFCDWLIETKKLSPNCRILEVGCGLGYFACAILDRVKEKRPDIYHSLNYTLFDLSPELQVSQKKVCGQHAEKTGFISGDIESFDFDGQKFDLIISNEVIADLDVAVVNLDKNDPSQPQTVARQVVDKYQLPCVPIQLGANKVAIINIGAIKMIERISRCLDNSAHAVITEYGTDGQSPKLVKFKNHHEFTIHFGQLMRVAEKLGLQAQNNSVGHTLQFQPDHDTIEMETLRTLRQNLIPACGLKALPVLAYTPEGLKKVLGENFSNIGNLKFLPLSHPNSFSPFRFELLELSKS